MHITAVADRSRPPAAGEMVLYDLAIDEENRPRAVRVRRSIPIRPKSRAAGASTSNPIPLIIASLFVLLVVAATLAGRLPQAVIRPTASSASSRFWSTGTTSRLPGAGSGGHRKVRCSCSVWRADGPERSSPRDCYATSPESVPFRWHSGEPS